MARRGIFRRGAHHAVQPIGHNGNGEGGQDRYPLLSGIDMRRGLSATKGEPGMFTATENDIGDIYHILGDMEGTTDNRESIPSPFSQTEAFHITLRDYPLRDTSQATVQQWRGAMCLALLYPTLFCGAQAPYWYRGIVTDKTLFIRLVQECKDNHAMDLYALCVQYRGNHYPLLYYSPECGVVPTAFGVEEEICDLPWLQPRLAARPADLPRSEATPALQSSNRLRILFFCDPIPYLSDGQLRLLHAGLTQYSDLYPKNVPTAMTEFRNDIDKTLRSRIQNNLCTQPEANLLLALLLRNTAQLGLHVVQAPSAVLVNEAPSLCSMASELCAQATRLVLLHGKPVAFLDHQAILCAINPFSTLIDPSGKPQPAYQSLLGALDTLLNQTPAAQAEAPGKDKSAVLAAQTSEQQWIQERIRLIQNQLARLQPHFPDATVLRHLALQYPPQYANKPIELPWHPIRAHEAEVPLLEEPFVALALCAVVQNDPRKLFSEEILYLQTEDSYFQQKMARSLLEIGRYRGKHIYTFLPADTYGGEALVQNRQASITCQSVDGRNHMVIRATFHVKADNILYKIDREYSDAQLRLLDDKKLPSVALWADVEDAPLPNQLPWQLYYVFVCFPYDRHSANYSAEVFDCDGQQVPPADQVTGQPVRQSLPMWWCNYRLKHRPGFVLFKHNSLSAGMLKLQYNPYGLPHKLFRDSTRVQLAIDFGTTASIAATRMGREGTIVRGLQENRITWLLNQKDGTPYAERYFIPNALCGGAGVETLVPSVVQLFDHLRAQHGAPGDEVHIDGSIFYLSDTNAEFDSAHHTRSGFKIMLNCDSENDRSAVEEQANDTRIFIKQLLHMYLLLCRMNHASHVDVYFATPIALSREERTRLRGILESAVRTVGAKAGYGETDVHVEITTESRAVGAYFKDYALVNSVDYEGIFTLDIGGGTSDYSFWERDKTDINASICCSNRLAGHELLGAQLLRELKRTGAIQTLPEVLRAQLLPAQKSIAHFKSLIDNLQGIKITSETSKIDLWLDQLFMQYYDQMHAALNEVRCAWLLGLINLQLAMLFWVGCLVFHQLSDPHANGTPKTLTLCLAGNGANFYRFLSPSRQEALRQVFERCRTPLIIHQQKDRGEQKTEVVKGLLLDDSLFKEPETDENSPFGTLDAAQVWESLLEMLTHYAQIYSDTIHDPVAGALALVLQKQELIVNLQQDLLRKAINMDMLNRHLVGFKNWIFDQLEELLTRQS